MQSRESRGRFFIPLFLFAVCLSSIWLVHSSLHPHLPEAGEPPCFYSNQSRQDLRLTVLEALKQAKQSIHLSIFGLSDPAILAALGKKITEKVETTVYYDPNGASIRIPADQRSSFIPVRRGGLMHQKILVVDHDLILIGSANLTSASLCMHDNLVIGFRSPKTAQFLIDHPPFTPGTLRTISGGQEIEIWLLPDPRGHALTDLRRRIRNASRSIRVALFTLTHPSLLDDLVAARDRGVAVSVVIDAHSGRGASAKAVERLKQAGIPVSLSQGLQLLHYKFALIDDQTLISGSANWTKAAFSKNSDCLFILDQLTQNQRRYMHRLWHRIRTESRPI